MKDDKKGCNCNIPEELRERVDEVIMDNVGKSQSRKVTGEELTEQLEVINPDDDSKGRG